MMRFELTRCEDGWIGPWREPTNISAEAAGSFHDDATARKLGLKGGTVAGSIHMEQFAPLLVGVLGQEWWRTGSLSLYFREATTHGEKVRCHAGAPRTWNGFTRVPVWMEGVDGQRINEGSASIGAPDQTSDLRRRMFESRPAGELRILREARIGDFTYDVPSQIASTRLDAHLPIITERCEEYVDGGLLGARALPMNLTIDAFRAIEKSLVVPDGPRVGLYGAIEVQYVSGPVFADRPYTASGRILALSDSPKTEIMWWEAQLADAESGALVATMLHMTRLMKASSPLWG